MLRAAFSSAGSLLRRRKNALLAAGWTLLSLLVGFYGWEDWRGGRDLAAARAEYTAAGLPSAPDALYAGDVPDADNFGALPLFREWGQPHEDRSDGSCFGHRIAVGGPLIRRVDRVSSEYFSVVDRNWHSSMTTPSWADVRTKVGKSDETFPAAKALTNDPLAELVDRFESEVGDLFDEAEAALPRPHCQLIPRPLDQWHHLCADPSALPRTHLVLDCFMLLAAERATLALAQGRSDRVIATLRIALRARALADAEASSAVERGLRDSLSDLLNVIHIAASAEPSPFTEAQWRELAAVLSQQDLWKGTTQSLDRMILWEDVADRQPAETVSQSGWFARDVVDDLQPRLRPAAAFLVPRGWWQGNEAGTLRLKMDYWRWLHSAPATDSPAITSSAWASHPSLQSTLHGLMSRRWMQSAEWNETTGAQAALQVKLAVVACALEAHHSRTGTYPSNLQQLTPALLPEVPRDVDGAALRYRLEPKRRYTIWSVGFDGVDDHGRMSGLFTFPRRWSGVGPDFAWRY